MTSPKVTYRGPLRAGTRHASQLGCIVPDAKLSDNQLGALHAVLRKTPSDSLIAALCDALSTYRHLRSESRLPSRQDMKATLTALAMESDTNLLPAIEALDSCTCAAFEGAWYRRYGTQSRVDSSREHLRDAIYDARDRLRGDADGGRPSAAVDGWYAKALAALYRAHVSKPKRPEFVRFAIVAFAILNADSPPRPAQAEKLARRAFDSDRGAMPALAGLGSALLGLNLPAAKRGRQRRRLIAAASFD